MTARGGCDRPAPYPPQVPKPTSVFACSACGAQTPKWHGQCPSCGEWNTLVEERASGPGARTVRAVGPALRPVRLREVSAERAPRLGTGIGELDMVLGGGLVPGSLVLLGGSRLRGAESLRTSSAFRNTLRRAARSNVGLPPCRGGRTDVRRPAGPNVLRKTRDCTSKARTLEHDHTRPEPQPPPFPRG